MTTSRTTRVFAPHRSIRAAALGVALTAIFGGVPPAATLADDATFTPITQNEHSIMLVESREPSSIQVATAFVPVTQNQRSIMLVESKEAPGGMLAGGTAPAARVPYEESEHAVARNRTVGSVEDSGDTAFVPQTANARSIALVESREAPVITAVSPNARAIALIEGRDPANAEAGQVASGG